MAKKQAKKKAAGRAPASRRAGRKGRSPAARATRAKKRTAPKRTSRAAKKTTARKTAGRGARGGARTAQRRTSAIGRAAGRTSRGGAPRSTRGAVWVESPDDLSQRSGQTLATRSHDVIRRWAEERGAEPATVPGADAQEPRVLRLNFPGFGGQNLEKVAWDDWFRTFDDRNLVFLFQERLRNGNQSNFFRLDNPEREDA